MKKKIEEFDAVALTKDREDLGLVLGQVGTVVELLGNDVFEVEFCDDQGVTFASVALPKSSLIPLRYGPVAA